MPRYIDADALKDRMFNYYECVNADTSKSNYKGETLMNYEVADMIEDCIDNAPAADVVEVVRCKDCVSFQRNRGAVISPNGYCFYLHNTMNANDFCSYGERKGANEYEKI